jgi:predicted O-methyltransferase YrrM
MIYTTHELECIYDQGISFKIQQKKPEWMSVLNILNNMCADNILEIGANTGGTTITLAHFAQKMISIDIINPPIFDVDKIDVCDYQYYGESSHLPSTIEYIKKEFPTGLDVLMIDGDHTHEGSYRDYLLYKDFVKPSGIIIFHDIVDSPNHQMHNCYVSKTWQLVKNNHNKFMEYVYTNEMKEQTLSDAFSEPHSWGGVGVIFK